MAFTSCGSPMGVESAVGVDVVVSSRPTRVLQRVAHAQKAPSPSGCGAVMWWHRCSCPADRLAVDAGAAGRACSGSSRMMAAPFAQEPVPVEM